MPIEFLKRLSGSGENTEPEETTNLKPVNIVYIGSSSTPAMPLDTRAPERPDRANLEALSAWVKVAHEAQTAYESEMQDQAKMFKRLQKGDSPIPPDPVQFDREVGLFLDVDRSGQLTMRDILAIQKYAEPALFGELKALFEAYGLNVYEQTADWKVVADAFVLANGEIDGQPDYGDCVRLERSYWNGQKMDVTVDSSCVRDSEDAHRLKGQISEYNSVWTDKDFVLAAVDYRSEALFCADSSLFNDQAFMESARLLVANDENAKTAKAKNASDKGN